MRPAAKRILAVVLAAAMVCPLASCRRKKKPQKTIIQESDPYFDAHVTELDIPLESESDKTLFNVLGGLAIFIYGMRLMRRN